MFFPNSEFPATALLEAAWPAIRAECLALPGDDFAAWPERPLYNHGWGVYGLYANTREVLENCLFCPQTTAVLRRVPALVNAGFSRLAAGTRIQPHVGYTREVLRLHLALLVPRPTACGLRVGDEIRHWDEGRCLVFDDTVEHEAWNNGPGDRLVLLIDIARPETPFTSSRASAEVPQP